MDENILDYLRMLKENANYILNQRTAYISELYYFVKQNYKRDGGVDTAAKKRYLALRPVYKRNKHYLAEYVRNGHYF